MQASKLFDLSGKIALVTGGSRGIGFQMAEALGEMGAKLAISARKQHELDAASASLQKKNIEVLTVVNDLGSASPGAAESLVTAFSTATAGSTCSSTTPEQFGELRPLRTPRRLGAR